MKHWFLLILLLVAALGMSTAHAAHAGHAPDKPHDKLHLDWQYPLNAAVVASPVVAGQQLVVASENVSLYSFDLHQRKFS